MYESLSKKKKNALFSIVNNTRTHSSTYKYTLMLHTFIRLPFSFVQFFCLLLRNKKNIAENEARDKNRITKIKLEQTQIAFKHYSPTHSTHTLSLSPSYNIISFYISYYCVYAMQVSTCTRIYRDQIRIYI